MDTRNRISLWGSAAVIFFFLLGHYVFGRDAAFIVMSSLVVGAAVTVSLTWARGAIGAMRSGIRDGAANILVSTWLVWTVLLGYFVWAAAFTAAGRPDAWRMLPVSGLFSTLIFLAGAHAVLTPINTSAELPRMNMFGWFAAVGFGGVVAGGLMVAAFLKIINYGA